MAYRLGHDLGNRLFLALAITFREVLGIFVSPIHLEVAH